MFLLILNLFILVVVVLFNFLLSYFLYKKNYNTKTSNIFLLYAFCLNAWLVGRFFILEFNNTDWFSFFVKLHFVTVLFVVSTVFMFCLNYFKEYKYRIINLLIILPALVMTYLIFFTSFVIEKVVTSRQFSYNLVFGDIGWVYYLLIGLYLGATFVWLLIKYFKKPNVENQKLKVFLIFFGILFLLMFFLLIVKFLPWLIGDLYLLKFFIILTTIGFSIASFFFVYAMIGYRIREDIYLFQSFLINLILVIYVFAIYALGSYVVLYFDIIDDVYKLVIFYVFLAGVVVLTKGVKSWLYAKFSNLFHEEFYDLALAQEALMKLISINLRFDDLVQNSSKYLLKTLKVKKAIFVNLDLKNKEKITYINYFSATKPDIDFINTLILNLKKHKDIFRVDDCFDQSKLKLCKKLTQLNIRTVVPIIDDQDKLLGFLLLVNEKLKGFTARDIKLLQTYALHMSFSFGNVKRFEDILEKQKELEKVNALMIGRELKMLELKKQLEENNK